LSQKSYVEAGKSFYGGLKRLFKLVRKVVHDFFKIVYSNDPDCNALTKAKERLSEQDKRGWGSSKPLP
jgi:hypothetical protein